MTYHISIWLEGKMTPTSFEVTKDKYDTEMHRLRTGKLRPVLEFKNKTGDTVFIITQTVQSIIFEIIEEV